MKLAQENTCQIIGNKLILSLTLQPELFWFQGHFPERAILPGVAQIDWVLFYAQTKLGVDFHFQGMDMVKFQRPLFPNEIVELTISWQLESLKINFEYTCEGASVSKGRISLCPM